MIQWIRLCFHCKGTGLIPFRELRSHMLLGQTEKKEERNIKKLETGGSSNCNMGEEGVKKRLLITVILT